MITSMAPRLAFHAGQLGALWLSLAAIGCGAPLQSVRLVPDAQTVLIEPSRITGDFVWRQRIDVHYQERQQSFSAVLEKRGAHLLLLGLTPFGTRAFALEQQGELVTYTPFVRFKLPFSPLYILADVHRAFFRGISPPPAADGVIDAQLDGETVRESWSGGRLQQREYHGAQPGHEVSVSIQYVGGMRDLTPAKQIVYRNLRLGYELTITTLLAQKL